VGAGPCAFFAAAAAAAAAAVLVLKCGRVDVLEFWGVCHVVQPAGLGVLAGLVCCKAVVHRCSVLWVHALLLLCCGQHQAHE
jgi:hypothetical protein